MTLDELAIKHGTDKSSRQHDYCRIYDQLFADWRNMPVTLVEIGVQFGYSILTWLDYFPNAMVHGIDCTQDFHLKHDRFRFWLGSQDNEAFLVAFKSQVQSATIIIDDACHHADSQKTAFDFLWPMVGTGGYYIIEDWFTNYDARFVSKIAGGVWLAKLVADLNWNAKQYHGKEDPPEPLTEFEKSLESIQLYKGLVILRKSSRCIS